MFDLQSIGSFDIWMDVLFLRLYEWRMFDWMYFFCIILGVAYFNMGAEYEHLKKASEALWHYQRV